MHVTRPAPTHVIDTSSSAGRGFRRPRPRVAGLLGREDGLSPQSAQGLQLYDTLADDLKPDRDVDVQD